MVYPLSPDRCFVAGPALAEELSQIVPDGRTVTDEQRAGVNRLMASFARESVTASPRANDMALRAELEPVLGQRWLALSRETIPPGVLGRSHMTVVQVCPPDRVHSFD